MKTGMLMFSLVLLALVVGYSLGASDTRSAIANARMRAYQQSYPPFGRVFTDKNISLKYTSRR